MKSVADKVTGGQNSEKYLFWKRKCFLCLNWYGFHGYQIYDKPCKEFYGLRASRLVDSLVGGRAEKWSSGSRDRLDRAFPFFTLQTVWSWLEHEALPRSFCDKSGSLNWLLSLTKLSTDHCWSTEDHLQDLPLDMSSFWSQLFLVDMLVMLLDPQT